MSLKSTYSDPGLVPSRVGRRHVSGELQMAAAKQPGLGTLATTAPSYGTAKLFSATGVGGRVGPTLDR